MGLFDGIGSGGGGQPNFSMGTPNYAAGLFGGGMMPQNNWAGPLMGMADPGRTMPAAAGGVPAGFVPPGQARQPLQPPQPPAQPQATPASPPTGAQMASPLMQALPPQAQQALQQEKDAWFRSMPDSVQQSVQQLFGMAQQPAPQPPQAPPTPSPAPAAAPAAAPLNGWFGDGRTPPAPSTPQVVPPAAPGLPFTLAAPSFGNWSGNMTGANSFGGRL